MRQGVKFLRLSFELFVSGFCIAFIAFMLVAVPASAIGTAITSGSTVAAVVMALILCMYLLLSFYQTLWSRLEEVTGREVGDMAKLYVLFVAATFGLVPASAIGFIDIATIVFMILVIDMVEKLIGGLAGRLHRSIEGGDTEKQKNDLKEIDTRRLEDATVSEEQPGSEALPLFEAPGSYTAAAARLNGFL